jgi:predicted GH43/DUF377 family glycosyl hydrolase
VIRLQRYSRQPILTPREHLAWEAAAVFNTGAIFDGQRVHLIYRATDLPSGGQQGPYVSSLGYAVSQDGVHFQRRDRPILSNDLPQEARGPEDPRLVRLGETYYMAYTGYGGRFPADYRICLASSQDLIHWRRHGVTLDEPNKDASLFPAKVDGRYALFHRRAPHIWIAFSEDLRVWKDHTVVLRALPHSAWESEKIGLAGPPLRTAQGWALIYHAVSKDHVYRLGIALLDAQDPTKVLARQAEPILEPELPWEVEGHVPHVVFSCGQVVLGDTLYVYYGGADRVIGLATTPMSQLVF